MEGIHKIMTHLWFDKEAAEAGAFYLSIFENSRLLSRRILSGTPSGDVESLTLEVEDINLMLLSAGHTDGHERYDRRGGSRDA